MLVDSHCHLHDRETYTFALSRVQGKHRPNPEDYEPEKILARARAAGVEKIICIGTTHQDSLRARDFAEAHDNVFWSYGIHPDEAPASPEPFEPLSKLQAVGEIGLDYRNGTENRAAQIKLLEQMLQLATDRNLPCIFHVREAFADFFPVLDNFPKIKNAVVHSFSDSEQNLKKSLNRGFYIGVNGLATFASLPTPPLNRILLETDAPFLAPVPNRGKVNEPAFVKNVAAFLAEKFQTTPEDVAKITTKNAETLFNI